MNMRRLLLAAAGTASLMLAIPGASAAFASTQSHPNFAAEATSFQNSALNAAMTRAPGGVRINANQVEWNNGTVVMTAPAAAGKSTLAPDASDTCPAPIIGTRWSCVYDEVNFGGIRLQFSDAGYYQDLHYYGGNEWETESWSNTRGQRAWLNEYESHTNSGESLCMTGNAHSGHSQGEYSYDRWIYLSTNYDAC